MCLVTRNWQTGTGYAEISMPKSRRALINWCANAHTRASHWSNLILIQCSTTFPYPKVSEKGQVTKLACSCTILLIQISTSINILLVLVITTDHSDTASKWEVAILLAAVSLLGMKIKKQDMVEVAVPYLKVTGCKQAQT